MGWNSHMSQNIKGQKFEFYPKMSKQVNLFFSSKPKYTCKFMSLQTIFAFFY